MRSTSIPVLLTRGLFLAVLLVSSVAAVAQSENLLDQGYRAMYNLDFESAHQRFQQWEQLHPADPMGPTSDAAAYLFSEFDRLHILEVELFADDTKFAERHKPSSDAQARAAFQAAAAKAKQLADTALQRDPRDSGALLAEVLLLGMQGDYVALIEKHDLTGLSYIKQGRAQAEKLLSADPSCYDAYLAVGVENYLLSLKPAPVRWWLRMSGAQTNRETGLDKLRLTAEKGHYLAPYARMLLAVAAVRDRDRERARMLLEGLAREFPHNHLYTQELARLR